MRSCTAHKAGQPNSHTTGHNTQGKHRLACAHSHSYKHKNKSSYRHSYIYDFLAALLYPNVPS